MTLTTSYTDPYGQTHFPDVLAVLGGEDARQDPWGSDLDPCDYADSARTVCQCGWRGPALAPVSIPNSVTGGPGGDLNLASQTVWESEHLVKLQAPMVPTDLEVALPAARVLLADHAAVEPLTAAKVTAELEMDTAQMLARAVREARLRGANWDGVGTAITINVSRQAALERFRETVDV